MKKDIAELIGILLGDGSIGIYKCKAENKIKIQHRIKISLHAEDDMEYSKYITSLMKRIFSSRPLIRIRKGEKTLDILLFGKQHVNFLLNEVGMKVSPKWDSARIPNSFTEGQIGNMVLRGYFDTDGCVALVNNNGTFYPRLEMKICPSPMRKQFIDMLKVRGFRFGAYQLQNDETRIQINGVKQLEKWYKEIGFSNSKNSKKAEMFVKSGSGGQI